MQSVARYYTYYPAACHTLVHTHAGTLTSTVEESSVSDLPPVTVGQAVGAAVAPAVTGHLTPPLAPPSLRTSLPARSSLSGKGGGGFGALLASTGAPPGSQPLLSPVSSSYE
jgi:hypothetical protein